MGYYAIKTQEELEEEFGAEWRTFFSHEFFNPSQDFLLGQKLPLKYYRFLTRTPPNSIRHRQYGIWMYYNSNNTDSFTRITEYKVPLKYLKFVEEE
jgi:hypothetical protein